MLPSSDLDNQQDKCVLLSCFLRKCAKKAKRRKRRNEKCTLCRLSTNNSSLGKGRNHVFSRKKWHHLKINIKCANIKKDFYRYYGTCSVLSDAGVEILCRIFFSLFVLLTKQTTAHNPIFMILSCRCAFETQ